MALPSRTWPLTPTSGTRSGIRWRAAESLVVLYGQVHDATPISRKTENDAYIGDAAHAARTSDHNPNSMGVVCALDITHDPLHGFDSYLFADYLRQKRDQRIKYIISNSRICYGPRSPSHGGDESSLWKWSPYNGENPHTEHCHISVGDSKFYDLSSPWDLTGFGFPAGPPTTAVTDKSLLKIGSTGEDVRLVQERIMVDGIYGSLTEEAVRRYQ